MPTGGLLRFESKNNWVNSTFSLSATLLTIYQADVNIIYVNIRSFGPLAIHRPNKRSENIEKGMGGIQIPIELPLPRR
jgi:hypothetical protein